MKVVVIGAGLAGLAGAYRLKGEGHEVVVLEAEATLGGRTSTIRKQGYMLERGATGLSTGFKKYIALATELGLDDALTISTNAIMLMREGKLFEISAKRPLSALFSGVLGLGSKITLLRTVRDYLKIDPPLDVLDVSASSAIDVESCADYARRRLDKPIYDALIDPLIRTYTLNRGENITALEWFSALKNLIGFQFVAMRGGIDRLARALASGLDVRLSSPAISVCRKEDGVEILHANPHGGTSRIQADACILATCFNQALQIAPEMQAAAAPLANRLAYNRSVVVHLGFARPTRTSAVGVLVPTVEHSQIGLLWLEHNKVEGAAPEGHSLFSCYFEEAGLDSIQPADDANFIAIAQAFVTKLFPEVEGALDMANVTRWDMAIPRTSPGVYKAISETRARLDPAAPIQLAGDYFTCTGQNSAIHWGQVAADNIMSGSNVSSRMG